MVDSDRRFLRFFGRRQLALLPTSYRVWESGVSSPSGVRGKAPAEIDFCVFIIQQKASSTTIWGLTAFDGINSGEALSLACLRALHSEEARASEPHSLCRL